MRWVSGWPAQSLLSHRGIVKPLHRPPRFANSTILDGRPRGLLARARVGRELREAVVPEHLDFRRVIPGQPTEFGQARAPEPIVIGPLGRDSANTLRNGTCP